MSIFSFSLMATIFFSFSGCIGDSDNSQNSEFSKSKEPLRLLFLGDSLTSGFTLPVEQAYPDLIRQKILDQGIPNIVINSGRNGDTSQAALNRVDKELSQPIDILVLALGVNDANHQIEADQVSQNLQAIIDRVRRHSPQVKIVIAGAFIPGFYSSQEEASYRAMYKDLSEVNRAVLVEDMLQGIVGDSNLNLSDGIHPNNIGHQRIADTLWTV